MPIAARLEVRGKDKSTLRSWVRASGIRAGLAQRARIVLLAGEGHSNTEIATRVGVSRPTVIHWRDRYAEGGLAALEDRKRSGRPRLESPADFGLRTLRPPTLQAADSGNPCGPRAVSGTRALNECVSDCSAVRSNAQCLRRPSFGSGRP